MFWRFSSFSYAHGSQVSAPRCSLLAWDVLQLVEDAWRRPHGAALDGAGDLVGDVLVNVDAFFCHGRSSLLAGRAIAASWGKRDRDHWQTPRLFYADAPDALRKALHD
jgi:hypothetical protein